MMKRMSSLLILSLLSAAALATEKSQVGPRTTYEKSQESTTGGAKAGAGSCLSPGEAGDVKAVMAAFKRHARRVEELREKVVNDSHARDQRQAHLAELDRQLSDAADTERLIAQTQPKSAQLAEARSIQSRLRKQKEELTAYDRVQEQVSKHFSDELMQADRCARELATQRDELRQGALEDRKGTVQFHPKGQQNGWTTLEGDIVVHPGDSIRTGADGHVRLRLPDGSLLELGPSAGFALSPDPGILGEQISGSILYQLQQFQRRMEVRTPSAVLAVRGTEFSLRTGSGTATELTAVDGKVEFTALPGAAAAARKSAWWAGKAASQKAEPLAGQALARLGESSARVKHRGGHWETARVGDNLVEDDLVRAEEGPLSLDLSGQVSALLQAGSVLQVRRDKEGRALYGLWCGRLYGKRSTGALGPEPVFTSPTAVCAVRGTEFEYHVPDGAAPEFIIYDGAIEVTADEKRFQDPERFRAWWED